MKMSIILIPLGLGAVLASHPGPTVSTGQPAAPMTLVEIVETRQIDLREPVKDDDSFDFNQVKPGLQLTFVLDLPRGKQLLEMSQPGRVEASDSTGVDLSRIEPDFAGETTYVEVPMSFGEDAPTEFTLQLGQPARAATSFSVQAEFEATAYDGVTPHRVTVGDEWVTLDPALFGGEAVKVRFGKTSGFFGDSTGLEMVPVSARVFVEGVKVTVNGNDEESTMSMWTDKSITFGFDGEFTGEDVAITLTLRTGMQTIPIRIRLDDQPLP